jgi:hypothetical protein
VFVGLGALTAVVMKGFIIHSSMAVQPFVAPLPLFQFLNHIQVGRNPWTGDQPAARPLPTYRTAQTQNKRTQTPRVGFEHTTTMFERAKTVHAITVMGEKFYIPG